MFWFLAFWVFNSMGQPVETRIPMPSQEVCEQVAEVQPIPANFECLFVGKGVGR